MTTGTISREGRDYLAAVEAALADLPADDRAALLEDLALHLAELGTDTEGIPLSLRLGTPASYAAELRTAAGLPERRVPAEEHGTGSLQRWWDEHGPAVTAYVRSLRPTWVLARGPLVVALLAAVLGLLSLPSLLLLSVGAAALSLALEQRVRSGTGRRLLLAGDVALGVLALPVALAAAGAVLNQGGGGTVYTELPPRYELESPYGPVTNIHPYSSDGKPLSGVLLFDQDGRPLRTATQEWWADGCERVVDHPRAADGVAVEFSYPQRYVLAPGSGGPGCAGAVTPPPVPLPSFAPAPPAPPAQSAPPAPPAPR